MARSRLPQTVATPRRAVLIADGDADTRALCRAMLEGAPYAIDECEDGAEALGKAFAARPDLIVADVRLARIDGLSLCRLLRAEPATRTMSIVLVTATDIPAEAVRARTAGADRVVVKPFTAEAIQAAAREAFEARRDASHAVTAPAVPDDAAREPSPSSRRVRSRAFRREHTTSPPVAPPLLHCPSCEALLTYEHSQTGGVNEESAEQWDYFRCSTCGPYQYRQRTRKLRAT